MKIKLFFFRKGIVLNTILTLSIIFYSTSDKRKTIYLTPPKHFRKPIEKS